MTRFISNNPEDANPASGAEPVPGRRRLIAGIFIVAVAAMLYRLGDMLHRFLRPLPRKNHYGGEVELGPLDSLPAAGSEPKNFPDGRFWLVHDQHGLSALHSTCTHLECLFGWNSDKQLFVCPCHGSEFGLDGAVLKGPATKSLERFEVRVSREDGDVVRATGEGGPVDVADLLPPPLVDNQQQGEETDRARYLVSVDTRRKILFADI